MGFGYRDGCLIRMLWGATLELGGGRRALISADRFRPCLPHDLASGGVVRRDGVDREHVGDDVGCGRPVVQVRPSPKRPRLRARPTHCGPSARAAPSSSVSLRGRAHGWGDDRVGLSSQRADRGRRVAVLPGGGDRLVVAAAAITTALPQRRGSMQSPGCDLPRGPTKQCSPHAPFSPVGSARTSPPGQGSGLESLHTRWTVAPPRR